MPRPYFTPREDPVPIVQEAGWAPGPVWTGRKSRPTGIRSLDRPARSQSLYRLSYQAHKMQHYTVYLLLENCSTCGISTHHQEHTQLHLQYLVLIKPLLLPAAIVEELELV
jgi:hypothetical protein